MKKYNSHQITKKSEKTWSYEKRRKSYKKPIIICAVLCFIVIALLCLLKLYTVDTVTIEGNIHYTNEEIQDMVLGGRWGRNSIYLSLKYKNKEIKNIPFIETMDVSIVSPHAVKIVVYEKAMAGYVEYMDQFFYFDKDGVIVESSNIKTLGIPQILGLSFDHIILYEKLPVEDDQIFKQILDITQLLNKYGIVVDKIYFDKDYKITLYFGEARVKLGNTDYIDEKIMRLKFILPQLDGKKGVLRMDNYSTDVDNITFELDK